MKPQNVLFIPGVCYVREISTNLKHKSYSRIKNFCFQTVTKNPYYLISDTMTNMARYGTKIEPKNIHPTKKSGQLENGSLLFDC